MPAHLLHDPVLGWYDVHARDLPWRDPGCSPWGVLVSEVMLQQTPVSRVLPAWRAWLDRWPRPASLAEDSPGEAIRLWGRLGYPRRAVRLHETSRAVVERHAGEVPSDHAALLALPGVGAYTAAAVASFAFGQRHAVVDTNVRRVLARAVTGDEYPAPSLTAVESRLAASLLPDDAPVAARWAVAVMELGALVCTARSPRCETCPLLDQCRWRLDGAPAHTGPPRRGQTYAGTDRYVRGLILAALRAATSPLPHEAIVAAAPDTLLRDPGQRDRCLDGLVADGLVEPLAQGDYCLPRRTAATLTE
ncbi:MAG: A/G-specific adenine glycosylase [Actinomycetota bacterium]|nr:A/G-specific adenine glycosylase [Actinomycetota bacterium]